MSAEIIYQPAKQYRYQEPLSTGEFYDPVNAVEVLYGSHVQPVS